jgi:hypothetical protein
LIEAAIFGPYTALPHPAAKEFLSFTPGVLASSFRRHLKSSSPQMPGQDMEIISAVFAGSVIREGFGKILAIAPIARPLSGRRLGTRPETHIHIHTPLIHLDKAGIIRLGLELKAPLELPSRATGPSPEPPATAHRATFASKASHPWASRTRSLIRTSNNLLSLLPPSLPVLRPGRRKTSTGNSSLHCKGNNRPYL